jgi:acetoin utilization deacetylase AcuC-like enzyme
VLTLVGPCGDGDTHQQAGHPERPGRIDAAMAGIGDLGLGGDLAIVSSRPAGTGDLTAVHTVDHLDRLRRQSASGGGSLDPDTYTTPGSWDAALLAAGAGLVAIDTLRAGGTGPAFVAARPPGHHALADRAMGFCLLNNAAVAAASLVAGGERVVIIDWDVHHGNGTQELFWNEPDVLYVSTHQWPCYPGTGRADETGGPAAPGTTLNVPLPPGATGDVLRAAFDLLVTPAVEAFSPNWVLVSAGFDAHRADPLADLSLSSGDFADLAGVVAGYAPAPDRLIVLLEGGYDLDALRSSVAATMGRLVGATAPREPSTSGGPGREQVDQVAEHRHRILDADG